MFLKKLLLSILLIAGCLVVYGNVIHFDFASIDDQVYVTHNTHIRNGICLKSIAWFFSSSHAANWHPITSLSLMLDHELYGLKAGGYHFTNLIFHILNTLLLFFLLNQMTGFLDRSFMVAALFALHPMHVESVAWISERKDVLSGFFWLLTIWAYFFYAKHPDIKRYLLVFIFFALGLMSKPMLVTLPFVLLLLDYWPLDRMAATKNLIIEKIPLLVLSFLSCAVTYMVQQQAGAVVSIENHPVDVRLFNTVVSYFRYLEKALLPVNLSVYYPYQNIWPFWQVVFTGGVIIFISNLILWGGRRYRYLPVGWLWYLGTLVPVIGLVQVGSQAMADRYSYIPFTGLFILAVWGIGDWTKTWPYKKWILGAVSVFILLIFSFFSWQRCQLWGNQVALWTDALKNYDIAFAYNIRGLSYAGRGDYLQAIQDYSAALALRPYAEFYNNRAIAYSAVGQYKRALEDISRALQIKTTFADAYYNRGLFYNELGKYDLAVSDFTSAIKIDPEMHDAFLNRGIAFGSQKNYEQALADFNQALNIRHHFSEAYYNRGFVFYLQRQYDLAAEDFSTALQRQPNNPKAHNYLGLILAQKGKCEESKIHFKKALQIQPGYSDAAENLRSVSVIGRCVD